MFDRTFLMPFTNKLTLSLRSEKTIQILQQEYAVETLSDQNVDQTVDQSEAEAEAGDISEYQLISEDETNSFRANMGKMKSVYTMLNVNATIFMNFTILVKR